MRPELLEIEDGVFAYVQPDGGWCLNNAGVLLAPSGTTVIDTAATEARARALRAAIGSVTDARVRTVVNTHSHGDHTFGNFVFGPDVEIIAHERGRAELLENGLALQGLFPDVNWGEVELAPANRTFERRLVLHQDTMRIELLHLGPAHTGNDVVVWLPDRGVLFTGDIAMSGCTPFVLMGSVSSSLTVLDRLGELPAHTVVCGHGPIAGPEVLDANARYLRWLSALAASAVEAGLTPREAAAEADLGEFADLLDSERLVANLHRAFAERHGAEPAAPLDVVGIFGEMVEFHGRLPVCNA